MLPYVIYACIICVKQRRFLIYTVCKIVTCSYFSAESNKLESLDGAYIRFGRPGVEMNVQHDSSFAVLQLIFLVNEVS